MPRHRPRDEDQDDFDDGPDGGDAGDDGWESETAPCPECGANLYEDADRCAKCGRYVSRNERSKVGVPLIYRVVAVVLVLAMLLSIVLW